MCRGKIFSISNGTMPASDLQVCKTKTLQGASGKPKLVGSGGSMVAKLKLKGIDGRAPPGVEPAA